MTDVIRIKKKDSAYAMNYTFLEIKFGCYFSK